MENTNFIITFSNNSLITYLKDEVVNDVYINLNQKDRFSFSYYYLAKNNMVSNYILTKSVINNGVSSFKNKFEFDYSYNNILEISQDKVIKYDANNNVIKYNETNYTYDTCGNILSINKKEGSTPSTIISNTTYIFSYDDGNLQSVYNTFTDYYKEYSYDYYGNIINIKHYDNHDNLLKEEVFTYTRKTLIDTYKMYENNTLAKSFKYYYNYQGIRYKKEDLINGNYINYTTNKYDIIYSSNGITYLYGENESNERISLLGFNYNNKTYFYVKDEVGNIVSIVSDGVEVVRYIYDSYGSHQVYEVSSNGELIINNNLQFIGNINPIRYKSYYYDIENNLYYLNSRYYDSGIGRFISPDDINYLESNIINGLNLYCYCSNNPVMRYDPNGNIWANVCSIWKRINNEIDRIYQKIVVTIDNIKEWFKNNVGTTIINEESYYTGYYYFCETNVGTGIILDSGKPINLFFKRPNEWWKFWEYSIGLSVNMENWNVSFYTGSETGFGFGGKNWSFDISMNSLGRLQFSLSEIANNGIYTFESFSLNGPEISLAFVLAIYVPYLLPALAPALLYTL